MIKKIYVEYNSGNELKDKISCVFSYELLENKIRDYFGYSPRCMPSTAKRLRAERTLRKE